MKAEERAADFMDAATPLERSQKIVFAMGAASQGEPFPLSAGIIMHIRAAERAAAEAMRERAARQLEVGVMPTHPAHMLAIAARIRALPLEAEDG